MEVIFWWAAIVWVVLAAGAVFAAISIDRKRKNAASGIPIAHSARLTALPGYRKALSRYRMLVAFLVAGVAVVLVASTLLTMRFSTTEVTTPQLHNRDIVLCLDVSGSMIEYDSQVLEVFGELTEEFTGERISLVVFNASAVTYFPLTSDYAYITRQMAQLKTELDDKTGSYFSGTLIGDGSSLIGDGLASCVTRFDEGQSERSRSVILVTDNLVAGTEIFTIGEAADLAVSRGVVVYGINPGDQSSKDYLDELADSYRSAVGKTGGAYYPLDDPSAVESIVSAITAEQAALIPGATQVVRIEQPQLGIALCFLGLAGLMFMGWRLRR